MAKNFKKRWTFIVGKKKYRTNNGSLAGGLIKSINQNGWKFYVLDWNTKKITKYQGGKKVGQKAIRA